MKKPLPSSDVVKIQTTKIPGSSPDAAREELEQRRTMLQNMKDFDFQIKKNQEEITNIYQKVESLSKDLDDLVSLYEIVSEQMNPFVVLSKVTKKRLDALENIIKEVDGVKTRIGDLESNLDKNGGIIKNSSVPVPSTPTVESTVTTEAPSISVTSHTIPEPQPVNIPAVHMESVSDNDLDILLNSTLESILMEQNIDGMINDFFINLK
jgi:seryl-tRNA synthetase